MLHLRIHRPGAAPIEQSFEGTELVIGRSQTSGLVLPDSRVSRQHARVFRRGNGWWIEDLGAKYGTLVNERPLTSPTALSDGDRLQFGDTTVYLGAGAVTGPPAALAPAPAPPPATTGPAPIVPLTGDHPADHLRTLNEVHRALATPISLPALLDLILERAFAVVQPEEGVILIREPDGHLRQAATRRRQPSAEAIFVSRRVVDEVIGKGNPVLVIDAATDARFAGSESIVSSGLKSVLAAPLSDAGGTIGLIALSSRMHVRQFTEADLDMLSSIASAAALRVRNVALAEEAAARRVLEHELALAHDMQMSMLPRQLPSRPGLEMAASLIPALSVGGDLYDCVEDAEGAWFIVADVSGKGVAAALYVAVAKTLFRAMVQKGSSVAGVVAAMNRELCRDNEQMMFVTAIVGRLTYATGAIAAVDAGHNPALIVKPGGVTVPVDLAKGVALGVIDDHVFSERSLTLDRGETLVLYTDGITDARNRQGEMFGAGRLEQIAGYVANLPAAEMVPALVNAVNRFAEGAGQDDDITVMVVRYHKIAARDNAQLPTPNSQTTPNSKLPKAPDSRISVKWHRVCYFMSTSKWTVREKPYDLRERLLLFGCLIVRVVEFLHTKGPVGRVLSEQLLKCGTSAGANYEEADDGLSPKDELAKKKIALRELKEARFRLRVLRQTGYLTEEHDAVINEALELVRILASIIRKSSIPKD